jgi:hypothetical protein
MRWGHALLVGGLLLPAEWLHAEEAVLQRLYGRGVHAYFSGADVQAHKNLTAAIQGGSQDPRCYYFRGLVDLRLGREADAELDFQKGADLESRDVLNVYDVPRSLERIQGNVRLKIEQYRVQARLAALERAERMRKARYNAIRRSERKILQEQAVAPRGAPAEPVSEPVRARVPLPPEKSESPPSDEMQPTEPAATGGEPEPEPSDEIVPAEPSASSAPELSPLDDVPPAEPSSTDVPEPEPSDEIVPAEPSASSAPEPSPLDDVPVAEPSLRGGEPQPSPSADSTAPVSGNRIFRALGRSLGKAVGGDQLAPAGVGAPGEPAGNGEEPTLR